jgi:hypothetical protein
LEVVYTYALRPDTFSHGRHYGLEHWGVFMRKGLKGLIEYRKDQIIKEWFDTAVQTYAPDTAEFIKGQKDPFANPVGRTTIKGLQFLLDQLVKDFNYQTLTGGLDPIIRIRAVQNFTPSQATAFIFSLKAVLRNTLKKELQDIQLANELLAFESKIDELCLLAFDVYMECREKVYQIGANETRNRIFRAFERAGLVADTAKDQPKVKKKRI